MTKSYESKCQPVSNGKMNNDEPENNVKKKKKHLTSMYKSDKNMAFNSETIKQ